VKIECTVPDDILCLCKIHHKKPSNHDIMETINLRETLFGRQIKRNVQASLVCKKTYSIPVLEKEFGVQHCIRVLF